MRILIFNAALAAACLYALVRGGRPERLVAMFFIAAALLTRLAVLYFDRHFHLATIPVFAIDALLLAALVAVALGYDRFWTQWMAAFQLVAVGVHVIELFEWNALTWVYGILGMVWSYPMVALLVIATARHQRRQRTGAAIDRFWPLSLPWSMRPKRWRSPTN